MVDKTLFCDFVDGCPLDDSVGGNGKVAFRIFRKGNELWGKPDVEGHKKTIVKSKTLLPRDMHHACAEWVINYWIKELNLEVHRCPAPKAKDKARYTKAVRARTMRFRKELINAGVQLK